MLELADTIVLLFAVIGILIVLGPPQKLPNGYQPKNSNPPDKRNPPKGGTNVNLPK
ncbi:MAG TPA: hypothetical protein V6D26_13025 [Stenomitos sp.]